MTKQEEPKFVAQTLAWCNARRKTKGKTPLKKLPKGAQHNPLSCPCGAATGLYVGSECYGETENSMKRKLPKAVRAFVYDFDNGKLPQYDEARG